MRSAIAFLLFSLSFSVSALEWKSELFHCTASLPEGPGWQNIEIPNPPGLTTLVVAQNLSKQAVFGINVVDTAPSNDLAEPAVQRTIEAIMRQFGYQFIGHSTMKVGGLDWLQYPVRSGSGAQQASGLIRFASAGGYIFGITMLKGGGQEAARDLELQQAAASFRVLPATGTASPPTPFTARSTAPAPATPPASPSAAETKTPEAATEESTAAPDSNRRLIWYGGAGLLILLFFFSIIGRGNTDKR